MQPLHISNSGKHRNWDSQIDQLQKELRDLVVEIQASEKRFHPEIKKMHKSQIASAKNLLHYMALRNIDIRDIQNKLHLKGLSSLTSSEGHVLSQLVAVLNRISDVPVPIEGEMIDYFSATRKRVKRSTALFGKSKNSNIPSIMVTFDTELADDVAMVKQLLYSGMNVARINCAHDNEAIWSEMVRNIKKAVNSTGIPCKIYMDLAGPKIRTVIHGEGSKFQLKKNKHFILSGIENSSSEPNSIFCSESGIINQLKEGERVLFDDGAIETVIQKMVNGNAFLKVIRNSKKSIKEGKGINFPESKLNIASLTPFDIQCLPFIVKHADMVGFSFVREPADLNSLQLYLNKISNDPPHIILKIETLDAVNNLPALLLQGMKEEFFGVMIARGDLAVEIGIERLSEIQDEILWICEAAHTPAIWATQVLESMNKSGFASRSEATDAARSAMAECVMINKGSHLIEVIESLRDILKRSGGHRIKKRYLFRTLTIAHRFIQSKFKLL